MSSPPLLQHKVLSFTELQVLRSAAHGAMKGRVCLICLQVMGVNHHPPATSVGQVRGLEGRRQHHLKQHCCPAPGICTPLQNCSLTSWAFLKLPNAGLTFHPIQTHQDKWFVMRKKPVRSNPTITPATLDHEGQTQLAGCRMGSPKGGAMLHVRSCNPQEGPS